MEAAARYSLRSMATAVRSALRLRRTASTDVNREPRVDDVDDELVYSPSVQDVLEVKEIIREASKLPLELIDEVIDFAEYWACSTIKTLSPQIAEGTGCHSDHRQSKGNLLVVGIP